MSKPSMCFHSKYWRLPLVYSPTAVCVCPSRLLFWTDVAPLYGGETTGLGIELNPTAGKSI